MAKMTRGSLEKMTRGSLETSDGTEVTILTEDFLPEDGEEIGVDRDITIKDLDDAVQQTRALDIAIDEKKEELTKLNIERNRLLLEVLPEMFLKLGTDHHGVAPIDGRPGYDAKLEERVSANIAASWEEDRRATAFKLLEKLGLGSIIRNRVELFCSSSQLKLVIAALEKIRRTKPKKPVKKVKVTPVSRGKKAAQPLVDEPIEWVITRGVSHQTLTSNVKAMLKMPECPIGSEEMKTLGASVLDIVKIKVRGESRDAKMKDSIRDHDDHD